METVNGLVSRAYSSLFSALISALSLAQRPVAEATLHSVHAPSPPLSVTCPQSAVVFQDLDADEIHLLVSYFFQNLPQFRFVWYFIMHKQMDIKNPTEVKMFLSVPPNMNYNNVPLLERTLTLTPWLKWCWQHFSNVAFLIFFFSINKDLGGRFSETHFGIHGWLSPDTVLLSYLPNGDLLLASSI